MNHLEKLRLNSKTRNGLWQHVVESIEAYLATVHQAGVAPETDPEKP